MNLRRTVFILAHELAEPTFWDTYRYLTINQWRKCNVLEEEQNAKLRQSLTTAYENVPYYHRLFRNLSLKPEDIRGVDDLKRLPILTKDEIRRNSDAFQPDNLRSMRFYNWATGGSCGDPLQYRLLKSDRFMAGALLYRGWGYAGYELGDGMVFLGGSSIGVGVGTRLSNTMQEMVRNIKKLSSFDMDDSSIREYISTIASRRPKYIYGYASSLLLISKKVTENGKRPPPPKAIFSTAERLSREMRSTIENAFGCNVFDIYGTNDGGVSAFECKAHSGLHIDTERAVMEIVDEDGTPKEEGEGRIIATSLGNYAMPFVRYDTGDIGYKLSDRCSCGREYPLLREIVGRQQEFVVTPEGKRVHGEFFSHLFWNVAGVEQFQVIQSSRERLLVTIVPTAAFDPTQVEDLRRAIRTKSEKWVVDIRIADAIDGTRAGKYRFVVNEMNE